MRKVTICKFKERRKPGKRDDWYEHNVYVMQPGTAWRYDLYGNHEVVEIDEKQAKAAEGTACTMNFDGRGMAIFKIGEQEYLQPLEEDPRATEDRLGKKRKKRKVRAPRRDAPGVAPKAISWENDGPAPSDESDHPARRASRQAVRQDGEPRPYRRAGPRRGLRIEI